MIRVMTMIRVVMRVTTWLDKGHGNGNGNGNDNSDLEVFRLIGQAVNRCAVNIVLSMNM